MLIKFLPYSGATAQTRSAVLWGVSGSYGQAPAQQGMSGLVRETSHLWLYSSPSPSLQPILREPATSILIVLYTFECIMWVATELLWKYVQGNKWILKLHFHNFSPCDWSDALKRRISYMLFIYKQTAIYIYIYFRDINNHLLHYTFILTGEIKTKALHLYLLIIHCVVYRWHVIKYIYNQT